MKLPIFVQVDNVVAIFMTENIPTCLKMDSLKMFLFAQTTMMQIILKKFEQQNSRKSC